MRKVLVLGSSGQIMGQILSVLSYSGRYDVTSLSRPNNLQLINGVKYLRTLDYCSDTILPTIHSIRPDVLIYGLAAGSIRSNNDDPEAILYINYTLPFLIASSLVSLGQPCNMFGFGSFAEYAGYLHDLVICPNTIPQPLSDYAISKVEISKSLWNLATANSLFTYHHITLASVYGGNEHPSRLIPKIISALKSGSSVSISSNLCKRDYVSCLDVAKIFPNIISSIPSFSRLIAGSGVGFSNIEVLNILANLFPDFTKSDSLQFYLSKSNTSPTFLADTTLFASCLGFNPSPLSRATPSFLGLST